MAGTKADDLMRDRDQQDRRTLDQRRRSKVGVDCQKGDKATLSARSSGIKRSKAGSSPVSRTRQRQGREEYKEHELRGCCRRLRAENAGPHTHGTRGRQQRHAGLRLQRDEAGLEDQRHVADDMAQAPDAGGLRCKSLFGRVT